MLLHLLVKTTIGRIANRKKFKEIKDKKRQEKQQYKKLIKVTFGGFRYFLSYWFGDVILFTCNKKFYEQPIEQPIEKPYQKFYTTENTANRYGEKLKDKYENVDITKVYDNKKNNIGYLLVGKGKKVTPQQQSSNVIQFPKANMH